MTLVEFEGRLHAIEVKLRVTKRKDLSKKTLDDAAEEKKNDRQDSKRFQEIEDIIEQLAHQVRKAEAEGDKYADDRIRLLRKCKK